MKLWADNNPGKWMDWKCWKKNRLERHTKTSHVELGPEERCTDFSPSQHRNKGGVVQENISHPTTVNYTACG